MVGDDVYAETCQQLAEARKRAERAEARLCDDCDGSGEYMINGEAQVCICVGEKRPYLKLKATLARAYDTIAAMEEQIAEMADA